MKTKLVLACILVAFSVGAQESFTAFKKQFINGYTKLNIPDMEYDYHDYFKSIPDADALSRQEVFFAEQEQKLKTIKANKQQKLDYDHIAYEINFNRERTRLEKQWVNDGRKIPEGGLHQLNNYKDWYKYFIKKFTGTNMKPEEVYALGKIEVSKVQNEIKKIRLALGYADSIAFYMHLQADSFYITDKTKLIKGFEEIDSTVRKHLNSFVENNDLSPVYAMEWPGAGQYTPPGIYLNRNSNAYGKDVFQFNFYGNKYNRRAMEWLYMHEAIPGHHLQSVYRKEDELQSLFLYPGNFEGWACYVEYYGKDVGLFSDPYSYLGKWEWDLVRSARVVLDVGIHYYGWTHEQAINYWKTTIPGQDDIAEREITRVTNWCSQTLSYKIGAHYLMQMREQWLKTYPLESIKEFHLQYLRAGIRPPEVIKMNMG
jgi:uncharacterized protein (DUF885 family)